MQTTHATRPTIPAADVEKAEAIAGFAAGQEARAKGYHPEAMLALAGLGKATIISNEHGTIELHPLSLQVQMCLMEHQKLYHSVPPDTSDMLEGLKSLTRLAYCFADPEAAFEALTCPGEDDDKRRGFDRESFALARYFSTTEEIDLLNRHISKEMGLLEAANPPLPQVQKKTVKARTRPVRSKR